MSLRYVDKFSPKLPYAIRVQVIDYARSVDDAAEDIFSEANRKMDPEFRDQLVLVAAIRKLHAICASSFWILFNSARLLGPDVSAIRAGSTSYSPDTKDYVQISKLLAELENALALHGVDSNLLHGPYTSVLEVLIDGRTEG